MPGRLLILDNEKSIKFAMADYFELLGYEVDCAGDLELAKDMLGKADYRVVLADLRLGGRDNQDGLEMVSFAHLHYPGTRLVLLTAYGSPAVTVEAEARGADMVLNKPIPLSTLAQVVSRLLKSGT